MRSTRRLLAGASAWLSLLIRDPAPEHSPIGHILFRSGPERGIRHSSFRAIVEAYASRPRSLAKPMAVERSRLGAQNAALLACPDVQDRPPSEGRQDFGFGR